jgi:hypothetical protein
MTLGSVVHFESPTSQHITSLLYPSVPMSAQLGSGRFGDNSRPQRVGKQTARSGESRGKRSIEDAKRNSDRCIRACGDVDPQSWDAAQCTVSLAFPKILLWHEPYRVASFYTVVLAYHCPAAVNHLSALITKRDSTLRYRKAPYRLGIMVPRSKFRAQS